MSQDDLDRYDDEEEGGGSPFDLKVLLLYGAWRSKHWIGLCTLLGTVGGLVAAASMPNVYQSVGKLDYRPGEKEVLSESGILGSEGFDTRNAPGMATELTLLDDLEPYKKVARKLGPAFILGKPDPTAGDEDAGIVTRLWHGFQKSMISMTHSDFDESEEVTEKAILGAARSLKSRTTLYVPPRSQTSIITVYHDGFSPEKAKVTNQEILYALQEFHLSLYATGGIIKRAEENLAMIEHEINVTATELSQHTELCGYKNIEDQRKAFLDQVAEDKKAVFDLEKDIAGLERRIAQLESDRSDTDEEIERMEPPIMGPNPSWTFEHEILLTFKRELATSEGEGRPVSQLNALREKIDAQQSKLDTIEKFVEVTPARFVPMANPYYVSLTTRLSEANESLEDKRGQLETLQRHIQDNENHIVKMDDCRELHREKQSYLELKWTERDNARKKLQATQDQDTLEEEGISALRLRGDASLPLNKTGPERIKPLGMGIALGLFLGLLLAVLRQFVDPTVRYRETVEKELDLPILTVVPESRALRRIKPGHVNVA